MKLIIAGGGTGGHVFPGIAIAQALKEIDPESEVTFVGTSRGIEVTAVPKAGFSLELIDIGGLKGKGISGKIKTLFALPKAFLQSFRILRRFGPNAVIGVGGYASGPLLLTAALMRIPTALCEPNSVTGFTNKILAPFVKRVFGAFVGPKDIFGERKYRLVGVPLRNSFTTKEGSYVPGHIAVFGGSLGAKAINEIVPLALASLKQRGHHLSVLHQTGPNEVDHVRGRYQGHGVSAEVVPFVDNMVAAYQKAELVICRSGAITCAELMALGIPSLLIPFPYAIYDHQTLNARELVEGGASLMLAQSELTPELLASEIEKIISNPVLRETMAKNAKALGKRDAALLIARLAQKGFAEE